jgi:hypothetical protein
MTAKRTLGQDVVAGALEFMLAWHDPNGIDGFSAEESPRCFAS